mgnify:CR=1 FL=1
MQEEDRFDDVFSCSLALDEVSTVDREIQLREA